MEGFGEQRVGDSSDCLLLATFGCLWKKFQGGVLTAGYLCESSVFGAATYLRMSIHLVRLSLDPNEEEGRTKEEDFFQKHVLLWLSNQCINSVG